MSQLVNRVIDLTENAQDYESDLNLNQLSEVSSHSAGHKL